jgi:hypothetical protein
MHDALWDDQVDEVPPPGKAASTWTWKRMLLLSLSYGLACGAINTALHVWNVGSLAHGVERTATVTGFFFLVIGVASSIARRLEPPMFVLPMAAVMTGTNRPPVLLVVFTGLLIGLVAGVLYMPDKRKTFRSMLKRER